MSVAVLISTIFVAAGTVALRMGGRIVSGQRPWRSHFALGGDFGDAMTHLLLAEMIRRNAKRLPRRTPDFLLSGPQDYPAFFHWLVALLPKSLVERCEWMFSPLIEGAHAALVFLALYGALGWSDVQSPLEIALLLVVAWILSPGLAMDMRRGGFLNERVFGFLFSNCFFMAMAGWLVTGEPLLLVTAALAGCIVAVSSKFGMQAIVFVTPFAALLLMDFRPLVLLAATVIAVLVLSRGYAIFVWRGSVRHTRFYARYLLHVGDYVTSFSTRQFVEVARLLSRGSVRAAVRLALEHPIMKAFTNSPIVWVSLVAAIATAGSQAELQTVLSGVVAAAAIVALITASDTFKYLGEGERYLEVAIAPALLLNAIATPAWAAYLVAGLVIYSVLRLLAAWRTLAIVRRNAQASSSADTRELLNWLAERPSRTIYAVPGRLAFPIAYAAPQHRYIWWFLNAPEGDRQGAFERLFEGGSRYPYPAPKQAYSDWAGERAEIIILHRPTVAACKLAWGVDYDSLVAETIFSNPTYVVMELRQTELSYEKGHAL
jgi:hypothetical protein